MGLDTMLRGVDLLGLTVEDVTDNPGTVVEPWTVRQQKTGKSPGVALLPYRREGLTRWIPLTGKLSWHYLCTSGRTHTAHPLSTTQYRRLVKRWAASARLDPRQCSPHSVRRTKATRVYHHTHNVEVGRQLLGHSRVAATSASRGLDQREALEMARQCER
jgi:integrase